MQLKEVLQTRSGKWMAFIIFGLSCVVIGLALLLGNLWIANIVLKSDAVSFASQAGFNDARRESVRGRRILLEIDWNSHEEGTARGWYERWPSGRSEGEFEVWFVHGGKYSIGHSRKEVIESYREAYNKRMRMAVEHPEWFDAQGNRIRNANSRAVEPPQP